MLGGRCVWDAVSRWRPGHSGAANLEYPLEYLIWPVRGYLGRTWLSFSVQPLFPPTFRACSAGVIVGAPGLAIVSTPCSSRDCTSLGSMYPGSHVMAEATDLRRVRLHHHNIFTPFSVAFALDDTFVAAASPVQLLLPACPCRVAILVSVWTLADECSAIQAPFCISPSSLMCRPSGVLAGDDRV
jgi:hypothetical protein